MASWKTLLQERLKGGDWKSLLEAEIPSFRRGIKYLFWLEPKGQTSVIYDVPLTTSHEVWLAKNGAPLHRELRKVKMKIANGVPDLTMTEVALKLGWVRGFLATDYIGFQTETLFARQKAGDLAWDVLAHYYKDEASLRTAFESIREVAVGWLEGNRYRDKVFQRQEVFGNVA